MSGSILETGGPLIVTPLWLACTAPEPDDHPRRRPDPTVTDGIVVDTGVVATGSTGHTGAPEDTGRSTLDCSLLVAAADVTFTWTSDIVTEEDFDFDGQGWLLTQRDSALQGIDREGGSHFVAVDAIGDPTGIRSIAEGDIIVAQPWTGSIRRVDPDTGGSIELLGGMSSPNGLEAGEDGMIFVTENEREGRVRMVDPDSGAFVVVAEAAYPNGIALSPDDQVLYFTSSNGSFGGQTRILSVARAGDGTWDPTTLATLYTHPDYVGSLTMDACGNLYGLEYQYGRVFRLDTTTGIAELVVDFDEPGSYSNLHFSPGLGGWDVNALYVTNRGILFEIPTGVPGSHVLTP